MKSSLRQTATPQHRSRPRGNDRPHPKTPSSGQHPRRRFLGLAAGAAALPAVSRIARAQTYPTRPVRIIVGFPPGGSGDIIARLMGQWLSERLGQPFIIENRAGAAGNIGTEAVVRAPPDGHTLLLSGAVNAINATLYDKLNFKFVRGRRNREMGQGDSGGQHQAMTQTQAKFITPVPRVDDTLLRCIIFSGRESGAGHKRASEALPGASKTV